MTAVQLFLFDDGSVTNEAGLLEVIEVDNVLVQDLIDTGAWGNVDRLLDAQESLREEVIESSADPDGFLTSESKVALKLVSERLRTLQAQSTCSP